jgi:hypothetical protein
MDGNFQQLLPANLDIPSSTGTSSSNKRGKSTESENKEDPPNKKKKAKNSPIREGKEKGNQVINPRSTRIHEAEGRRRISRFGPPKAATPTCSQMDQLATDYLRQLAHQRPLPQSLQTHQISQAANSGDVERR